MAHVSVHLIAVVAATLSLLSTNAYAKPVVVRDWPQVTVDLPGQPPRIDAVESTNGRIASYVSITDDASYVVLTRPTVQSDPDDEIVSVLTDANCAVDRARWWRSGDAVVATIACGGFRHIVTVVSGVVVHASTTDGGKIGDDFLKSISLNGSRVATALPEALAAVDARLERDVLEPTQDGWIVWAKVTMVAVGVLGAIILLITIVMCVTVLAAALKVVSCVAAALINTMFGR